MAFILASLLKTHYYDDLGNRVAVALENENGILSAIKRYLPNEDSLVVVANDSLDFEDNDAKLDVTVQGFIKTGMPFKHATALDARNKADAEKIISSASMIILSGGKCWRQKRFFDEIELQRLLKSHKGLTIGVSAGAMNLCKTVANFPEEECDLNDPTWFDGMGFFDGIVIPHFDGEAVKYQFDCGDIDIVGDYVLPMSHKQSFLGIPNGAFITVDDNGKSAYHGDIYSISKGAVKRKNF